MGQTLEAVLVHGDNQLRIDYTPGADVACGEIVLVGAAGLVGYCSTVGGIAAGVLGSLDIGPGCVYRALKDNTGGPVFSLGELVGWDDTANLAVEVADADFLLGTCTRAAGASDDGVEFTPLVGLSAVIAAAVAAVPP